MIGLDVGEFGLHYVRDKAKREDEFLVTRDGDPWFLVEVKTSDTGGLSPALRHFAPGLRIPHVFEAGFGLPHVDADCFAVARPLRVPVATLLSQWV